MYNFGRINVKLTTVLRIAMLCVFLAGGAALFVKTAAAQCPDPGSVGYDGVSNTPVKPFQAKQVTTIVASSSDGTKVTTVHRSNVFRDSKGRIRHERRFYPGEHALSDNVPLQIWINDECGNAISLSPGSHTATIQKMVPAPQVSRQPVCREIDSNNIPDIGPAGKFEDLGHKSIDGVVIRGERSSYYSSEQAKLAGAPPIQVYENWCSISLDTWMGSYSLTENPKQEITTVVSDVEQIEPDPALFEIPPGYKIEFRASPAPSRPNPAGNSSAPPTQP
jgi:hypothetical protein